MSISLQTTLADEAHLAEGQYLLEKQTLNKVKSLMHRARIIIINHSLLCAESRAMRPIIETAHYRVY
jgi:hypothetical protein